MTQSNERLDRIERILENVAERQDRFQERMDALADRQDRFQAQLEVTRQEMHQNHEYIGSEIGGLTRSIAELRVVVDQSVRQAELDRAQFSRAVEQMIDLLTRRFSSNGHNE